MRNLHVSCYKVLMLLLVALTIFYSCTADENLLFEAVNRDGREELNTIDQGFSETSSSDPIPLNQIDTTEVGDKPSNVPLAIATPSSGVPPLEVTFSVSNSLSDKTFAEYEWKFKDGTKASSSKAVHTFEEVGKHKVELTATDEQGQILIDSVTVSVIESENELPVAAATASHPSGNAPLDVRFTGSGSTDDNGIKSYLWDFKDGSSSTKTDPSYAFSKPGTYQVELTVTDEKDLTDKATVTITVDEPINQAPKAVATANHLSGEAPLQVDFTGSGSSDDKGVVGYYWNFPRNASSDPNTAHTFNDPGIYDIPLTVTDAEGLKDTATLTVTVSPGSTGSSGGGRIPCSAGGGLANETGEKVWCWKDITLPEYSGSTGVAFSDKQLFIASECYEKQVTRSGDRLRFRIDPTTPGTDKRWCSRDYNMRAEIRTAPWNVRHPKGTEEWFGWDYTFGNDYVIDRDNEWLFFQVHNGVVGKSPQMELMVSAGYQYQRRAGEIYVMNHANGQDRKATGIVPRAGQTLKIVVHAIWGDSSNGLLQVWINGQSVYDRQVTTVYADSPWGGNAKWGIYKWPWIEREGVQESLGQGITHIETSMGPLRMITRRPGDPDYRKDSYYQVVPD